MKPALVSFFLLGVVACHDATKPAVPIADQPVSMTFGTRVASTGGVFFVATLDSTSSAFQILIDTFPITGPGVYTIRKSDPNFAQATARLTNGHRDIVEFGFRLIPNGGGFTRLDQDYDALGRIPADPDLAAYALTAVSLVVDSASVASPGTDPNQDGIWTDATFRGHPVVYGDSL